MKIRERLVLRERATTPDTRAGRKRNSFIMITVFACNLSKLYQIILKIYNNNSEIPPPKKKTITGVFLIFIS